VEVSYHGGCCGSWMQRGTIPVQKLCDVLVPVAVSVATALMTLENGANRSCVAIGLDHEL
jgi:hypothetical protein